MKNFTIRKGDVFWISSLLAVMAIRIWVFLYPWRKIRIDETAFHHFWLGALFIALALTIPRAYDVVRVAFFSFGFAACADELFFLLGGGGTTIEYWSHYAVIGVIVIMVVTFIFRHRIAKKFL